MATRFTYGARLLGLMLLSIGALQLSGCDMVLFNPKGQVGVTVRPTHLPDPDAKGDGVHLI